MKKLIKYNLYKPVFIKPNNFNLSHSQYLLVKTNCINRHKVNINNLMYTLSNQSSYINYNQDNINNLINMYENNLREDISNSIYEAILNNNIFNYIGSCFNISVIQTNKQYIYIDISKSYIYITSNTNSPIGAIPINNINLIKSLYKFISFNN